MVKAAIVSPSPAKAKRSNKKTNVASTPVRSGASNSDAIVAQKVVDKTKAQYATTLQYIARYCAESQDYKSAVDQNGDLILPMTMANLRGFMGDMGAEREDKTVKSISTVTGYCTVIKYYTRKKAPLSQEQVTFFKDYHEGYKRVVAQKKLKGQMKKNEGKVGISFHFYQALCKVALFASEARSSFSSFVHLFCILCWNLFARSISVAELRTHHFTWDNDCIVIDMSLQKGDQTGESIEPKHLFANPYEPSICVVLALALHMFSVAFRPDNDDKDLLFLGSPYDVFSKWLPTALQTIAKFAVLGYLISDFGTHSFRKGIATFCSGFIGGPSVIAIFQRAGWSLGQVQDRYITFSDGGDQLCGRVAAGLNFNGGSKFAVLPPHFDRADILSAEEWNEIVPGYAAYPLGFQTCMPYLLASLVFHWDWLNEKDEQGKMKNISPHHPIFHCRVVSSGIVTKLKGNVIGNVTSGKCTVTGMTATGIPPHVDLHRQIEDLRAENLLLRRQAQENHNEVMEKLPTLVTEKVLENVRVEGVQQMSRNDLECMMTGMFEKYSVLQASSSEPAVAPAASHIVRGIDGWPGYTWGGKMGRSVPQYWTFPRANVKPVCDLFMTGQMHAESPIRPFRFIVSATLPRNEQSYFSRGEQVFVSLKKVAIEIGVVEKMTDFDSMTIIKWDSVFAAAFDYAITKIELAIRKPIAKAGEMSVNTFYNYLKHIN